MIASDTCYHILCSFSHMSYPPHQFWLFQIICFHTWSTLFPIYLTLIHLISFIFLYGYLSPFYHSNPYRNTFGRDIIILACKEEEQRLKQLNLWHQPITLQERLDRKYPLSRNNTQDSKEYPLLGTDLGHSDSQGTQRLSLDYPEESSGLPAHYSIPWGLRCSHVMVQLLCPILLSSFPYRPVSWGGFPSSLCMQAQAQSVSPSTCGHKILLFWNLDAAIL